ncbi:MAG: ABC transporter permease, partial [Acidobacteria bacterium]|nr:ABC transporter permease [Acidobacteriota bacterium]
MNLFQDLRFGLRMARKQPALAAIAILALALGIGLTTTMFSIINGAVLRGLPFREAGRLMHVSHTKPAQGIDREEMYVPDFVDYRAQQTSFTDLGAFYTGTVNLTGNDGIPERYDGAFITAGTFPLLGVQPVLGRTFVEGENQPGAEPVVLLGYELWSNRFAADPAVVGRTVRVNGRDTTVVGVMPESFAFPVSEEIWVPLPVDPDVARGEGTSVAVVGRLRDGVDRDRAQSEFTVLAERMAEAHPDTNAGAGAQVEPYTEAFVGRQVVAMLWVMLAAVFSVLIIACVNVANLLLGRAAVRSREAAIRTALGASRWRVAQQLLAETFVLVLGGAAGGLLIAKLGIDLFNRGIASTNPPFWIDIRIDLPVLGFVALLALAASLMAGVVPALRVARGDVQGVLQDESRGSSSLRLGRLSRALVVLQLTFSCALLAGAGLMIKSVVQLRTLDLPFADADIFSARVGLFESDYPDDPARLRFFESLIARLEQQPGADAVAVTSVLPGLTAPTDAFSFEGDVYRPEQSYPRIRQAVVSPGYFQTLGLEPSSGRIFSGFDRPESEPVVVVNQAFVRRYLGGEDPVGRRMRFGRGDHEEPWRTIVGVVPDLEMQGINQAETPEGAYLPLAQSPMR